MFAVCTRTTAIATARSAVARRWISIAPTKQPLKAIDNSDIDVDAFFKGKKVVLFGLPGAFTPICSNQHVPSYIENADKLKSAGVDTVACVSVNDSFTLKAWSAQLKAESKVEFIADWNAELVKQLGLDIDLSAAGLGVRAKRFSLVVDNGEVVHQNVEENPGQFEVTGADVILKQLAA
eukprot:TRINITY_DN17085_c0_g1_i1.p2 TRINITY_DN17085_c0_g1~~TRINITY_DN17085_c0_g1_i1.p2  ORF type:complete len:187 (+),score=65.54 TRINITY_DN17085_c0_g1_i1:27-563(+)